MKGGVSPYQHTVVRYTRPQTQTHTHIYHSIAVLHCVYMWYSSSTTFCNLSPQLDHVVDEEPSTVSTFTPRCKTQESMISTCVSYDIVPPSMVKHRSCSHILMLSCTIGIISQSQLKPYLHTKIDYSIHTEYTSIRQYQSYSISFIILLSIHLRSCVPHRKCAVYDFIIRILRKG